MIDRVPLITERLRLEPVEAGHAEALWEATRASLAELRRWLFWAAGAGPASTREFAEEAVGDWADGTAYQFVIRDEDGIAGAMGIEVPIPVRRLGEVGYWIHSQRTRRGYATEAGRALVGFGFDVVGLYRLELRAGVDNLASERVAEKLGFRREGTLRQGCPLADGAYDGHLFGLLAADPRP